jgi:hypothetical protein
MKYIFLSLLFNFPIMALRFEACDPVLNRSLANLNFRESISAAQEFEKIYNRYHNNSNFESCLIRFIKSDCTKNYWIGIFLYETDYTSIKNFQLSEKILNIGIKKCKEDCDEVAFHAILGLLFLKQNKNKEARYYFIYARDKSKIKFGCWPAMSELEYNFIEKEFDVKP